MILQDAYELKIHSLVYSFFPAKLFPLFTTPSFNSNYWSLFCILKLWIYTCRIGNIPGFAMACSNTFGLVTGAFLLGFGLSEIPKGIWRCADWTPHQKILSHKVAKMAVKLDDAHQEFSNIIVVSSFLDTWLFFYHCSSECLIVNTSSELVNIYF